MSDLIALAFWSAFVAVLAGKYLATRRDEWTRSVEDEQRAQAERRDWYRRSL